MIIVSQSQRVPNFFLIGAPKCGTTSLASWLSAHQMIFMCEPKEPHFFSTDIQTVRAAETLCEYNSLFQKVKQRHIAVGEASTTYLRSHVAVPGIIEFQPAAKFIVCLRNPIDMLASVHAQLFQGGREPEANLERAWSLQEDRRQGRGTRGIIGDAKDFQYGENCLLGKQVERLLTLVNRRQVIFVFVDDLKHDPSAVFSQVLKFLQVPLWYPSQFTVENARSKPRFRLVSRVFAHVSVIKYNLGLRESIGIGRIINKVNRMSYKAKEDAISPEFERELEEFFRDDILLLSRLTGRDLSEWTNRRADVT